MKKALMILASVALGASMATAATNVVSKNVVGFNTDSFVSGEGKMKAMQFCKPGGLTNTFEDLGFDPTTFNLSEIQIPYLNGSEIAFSVYTMRKAPFDPQGWYDGDYNYVGTANIPAGQGFWVFPQASGSVPFIGEVLSADLAVTVEADKAVMLGNPYPVEIKFMDLPFNPVTYALSEIQIPYLIGGSEIAFSVYTMRKAPFSPEGWYDGDYNYVGTTTIPLGQGFWLIPSSSGTVTFNSPL